MTILDKIAMEKKIHIFQPKSGYFHVKVIIFKENGLFWYQIREFRPSAYFIFELK